MLAAGSSSQVLWQNLRAPQLRALAATDATVIVPVGAMEQHGPHLPVQVDSLLATEVAIGAAVSSDSRRQALDAIDRDVLAQSSANSSDAH